MAVPHATVALPLVGVTGLDAGATVVKGQVGALREGLTVTYTTKTK
jgi:hypothetical protein